MLVSLSGGRSRGGSERARFVERSWSNCSRPRTAQGGSVEEEARLESWMLTDDSLGPRPRGGL